MNNIKDGLKKFWNWLWKSESWWSYIVFLILIFIVIKFIFLPVLGLIFGTSLPLAIVESSSMEHYSLTENNINYVMCGKVFPSSKFFNLDEYWQNCGSWYEERNITKQEFSTFKFPNGFRKGDIIVIFKKSDIKIGDIIIFNAGTRIPIIHRVISLSPLQTKGDHNPDQLKPQYGADETNIKQSQIIGVAVARIPYLGLPKVYICNHWNLPLICR